MPLALFPLWEGAADESALLAKPVSTVLLEPLDVEAAVVAAEPEPVRVAVPDAVPEELEESLSGYLQEGGR